MKKSFAQKLTFIGELRRFRRHSDLRAEISQKIGLKSCKKDEAEPSYELLSGEKTMFAQKLTLIGELRRFRRDHDLRAEIS